MDEPESDTETNSSEGIVRSRLSSKLTVEPVLFGLILGFAATDGIKTTLTISRTCTVVYNYTTAECAGVLDPEMDQIVHAYVAKLHMSKTIIDSLIVAFLSFFIGPWTDQNGRKLFIILPLIGSALSYVLWIVFLMFPNLHPIFTVFTTVPTSIVGGTVSLFSCVYCYIADVTTETNRPIRLLFASLSLSLGSIVGYSMANPIIKYFDNSHEFLLFTLAIFISIVLTVYIKFLPESLSAVTNRTRFFSFRRIKRTFSVIFTRGAFSRNVIIVMLALIISIVRVVIIGESSYQYLVTTENFSWSVSDYNAFSAVTSLSSIVLVVPTVYVVTRALHVNELHFALVAAVFSIYSSILITFCQNALDFYLVSMLTAFASTVSVPLIKSSLARTVPFEERGTVFTFLAVLEEAAPVIGAPLYRLWFNKLLQDHATLDLYFLSTLFWVIDLSLILTAALIERYSPNYDELRAGSSESVNG